jgi:tetratricopeptide (TPR) repeat protein
MGALAGMRGQVDESHTYFRRVQLIEPLAPNVNHGVAVGYYRKGNYLAAIAQLEVALELNPNYGVARSLLGRCYLRVGDYDRAIAEFSICEPTIGTDADLPSAFALSGRSGEARTALEALLAEAADRYVSALDVATIHAALGDAEQALTWLQRAVEEVAPMAWGIKTEPAFAHLRTDPRFQSLVNRIGVE